LKPETCCEQVKFRAHCFPGLKDSESARRGLWSVEVPGVRSGLNVRQLFVGGQRRERARWPRSNWFAVAGAANGREAGWAGTLGAIKDDELARRSFRFRPGDLRADLTSL
jgi:hypothetical protein